MRSKRSPNEELKKLPFWEKRQLLMESYQKVNRVTESLANHWISQMTDEEIEDELAIRGIGEMPNTSNLPTAGGPNPSK